MSPATQLDYCRILNRRSQYLGQSCFGQFCHDDFDCRRHGRQIDSPKLKPLGCNHKHCGRRSRRRSDLGGCRHRGKGLGRHHPRSRLGCRGLRLVLPGHDVVSVVTALLSAPHFLSFPTLSPRTPLGVERAKEICIGPAGPRSPTGENHNGRQDDLHPQSRRSAPKIRHPCSAGGQHAPPLPPVARLRVRRQGLRAKANLQ